MRLGPLIRADDRSAQRELCNIARFRPTFSAFDFHIYSWTPVLSLSVMLLLPAIYCCRYAMQRDIYTTPSSGDEAGICRSFGYTPNQLVFRHTPKMTFSSCYNKLSVWYFGLKLHRHILGTPKTNITSCKKGHNCLRPFRDFNHHTVTSNNHPFLFSSKTCHAVLNSLSLSVLIMIFASFSDTFKFLHWRHVCCISPCLYLIASLHCSVQFIQSFCLFGLLLFSAG